MRLVYAFLLSSSLVLSGCITPLTKQQRCALEGEYYTGSTATNVQTIILSNDEYGTSVINHNQPVRQLNCKRPTTDAEKKEVTELMQQMQELRKKARKKSKRIIQQGGIPVLIATILGVIAYIGWSE